ncbi:hypothetical protein OAF44_01530, partial [Akkermansiaceae bacterium]|nr:hypothetical protein [Akkermansiaceae bacterium]
MARQNRWATFGQAFNAVYDVGTTLGKSIESGKIAIKDYEDDEGNKLTGLALDRAKMDDYAAVEQKYGDPMEALRMRTGVETLGQNRLKTDYDTDTYDERVFQGGIGASNKLRADTAYTNSAAGLNVANTGRVNLATDIRRGSKNSEISYNINRFNADSAQARAQKAAYSDSSYSGGLIAAQEAAQAEDNANTKRFGSSEYAASLKATDNQTTAEATLARSTADLQNTVMTDPIYKANFIAAEKAKMGQTATIAQIDEQIAKDPKTLQLAEKNLDLALSTAMTAVNNAQTDLNLSYSADFQAAQYNTGLSNAELGAVQGEEAVILAQQSLAANTFIREWSKTGNPDDPTSMRNLIKGISQINPMMGQKLSQDYGEHELWEITNRSLRMKAETNEALQNRGAAGAQEILDKYNGEDFGIRMDTNPDDGSMSMVETDKEGNVVRTIASGADERAFMQDLNAALDPASLMEYSMNLVDMDYKRALTMFSEAQAKAAGVGKPLGATDMAYRTMVNPEASAADRKLATAFLMRESPELYAQIMQDMDFQSVLGAAGNGDGGEVPNKLVPEVDVSGEQTVEERTAAESVMAILAAPASTAAQRTEALKGNNRKLVEKYFGKDALTMEDNKSSLVDFMELEISKGRVTLTPEGMDQLAARYQRASEVDV